MARARQRGCFWVTREACATLGVVLPQDVSTLARALLAAPEPKRGAVLEEVFETATIAHHHLQRTGRIHPQIGDGTLDAAARRYPLAREPLWSDVEYAGLLLRVLQRLLAQIAV